ncbi:MAG: 4-hydroxy-tetrahydrodipicolinate synthase [Erysipelotrichaceae bacterium]
MIEGSIVALITPFKDNGDIDFDRLGELIEYHIKEKTDGILVLGTTGESPTLTHDEDEAIAAFTIKKSNKRIPIIVGSGSNSTKTAVEQSIKYEKMGADALLVITPYYNKTNEAGMLAHFESVANAVKVPLILYNVPSRTGCSISIPVLTKLSKMKNIVAIKEASGNISYAMNVAKLCNDEFCMYSGNDDIVVPMLSIGSKGVISVAANIIPNEMHTLVREYLDGNIESSLTIQLKYLEFIHALFIETNPIPIKEAMLIAKHGVGGYRLPLTNMSDSNKEVLKATMKVLKN